MIHKRDNMVLVPKDDLQTYVRNTSYFINEFIALGSIVSELKSYSMNRLIYCK